MDLKIKKGMKVSQTEKELLNSMRNFVLILSNGIGDSITITNCENHIEQLSITETAADDFKKATIGDDSYYQYMHQNSLDETLDILRNAGANFSQKPIKFKPATLENDIELYEGINPENIKSVDIMNDIINVIFGELPCENHKDILNNFGIELDGEPDNINENNK